MEQQNPDIANAVNLSSAESDGDSPLALDSAQVLFDGLLSSSSPLPRYRFALRRRRSRCFHRSISYIKYWKSRSSYVSFGTLTTRSGHHSLDELRHYFVILSKRIRHHYHQSPRFEYIKILDIGEKSGMLHIHFLFNKFLPWSWVKEQWLDITGDSDGVYLESISSGRLSIKKASGYMAGYINKSYHRYTRSQKALPKGIGEYWRNIFKMCNYNREKAIIMYDDWLINIGRRSWSSWLRKYASHDPQQSLLSSFAS